MNKVLDKVSVEFPFPGLRPFQEGEEHLFFGRESQSDAMIDKLAATRFLAVIGTSGSGKSSLVNCGLCLGLRSGLMPSAGTAWRIASCRPGDNPIVSLAKALAANGVLFNQFDSVGMSLPDIIETNLRMSKLGIVDVYEQSRQADNTNLLIIVDQFEELFRFQKASDVSAEDGREEAIAFVKLLLAASSQSEQPVYVVLTMRSDFLGECTRFEGLTEAINQGQYLIPRMTREQRRQAIAGPIGVAGASMDDVLLTRLVNELGDNHDQLSILQHALNRIWANWAKQNDPTQPLSLQNYAAIGSMTHALDLHAEKAYSELTSPRHLQIAAKLFKALTDKTTHTGGIRRPTSIKMLCELTGSTQDELTQVIDVFRKPSRSFLMPRIDEDMQSDTMVDISHESLMRMWQRLIGWSDEEAISATTYLRLASTAELHEQDQAGLWRDPDLQLALEWRQQNEPNDIWASRIAPGFDKAMHFLDESRARSDEEKAAQLQVADQQRELEHAHAIAGEQQQRILAQKKASIRQKRLFSSIIAGLVATLWLGYLFVKQGIEATLTEDALAEEQTKVKEKEEVLVQTRLGNENLAAVFSMERTKAAKQEQALTLGYSAISEALTREQNKILELSKVVGKALDTSTSETGAVNHALQLLIANNLKIHNQVWQLVRNNDLTIYETPTNQVFDNRSTSDHQLFMLSEAEGLQANKITILPAGKSLSMDGFVNQIWFARILPEYTVTATGVMRENAEPEIFD